MCTNKEHLKLLEIDMGSLHLALPWELINTFIKQYASEEYHSEQKAKYLIKSRYHERATVLLKPKFMAKRFTVLIVDWSLPQKKVMEPKSDDKLTILERYYEAAFLGVLMKLVPKISG